MKERLSTQISHLALRPVRRGRGGGEGDEWGEEGKGGKALYMGIDAKKKTHHTLGIAQVVTKL